MNCKMAVVLCSVLTTMLSIASAVSAQDLYQHAQLEKSKIEQLRETMGLRPRASVQESNSTSASSPALPATSSNIGTSSESHIDVWVYFDYDDDAITPSARSELDKLGEALANPQFADDQWLIEGHTDASGDELYNLDLSARRARSVYQYLINTYRLNPSSLVTIGKGEKDFFDKNNPLSPLNRRVRIKYIGT